VRAVGVEKKNACASLFSRRDLNILFTTSRDEISKIDVSTGDAQQFEGYVPGSSVLGQALALSENESLLFVGDGSHNALLCFETEPRKKKWNVVLPNRVTSLRALRDVQLLVGLFASSPMLVDQANGAKLREFQRPEGSVQSIALFSGYFLNCCSY
jgi:hypothetical protein